MRFRAALLLMVPASCAATPSEDPGGRAVAAAPAAARTGGEQSGDAALRALLADYGRGVRRSVRQPGGEGLAAADRLRALGDAGGRALAGLVRVADPAVTDLGGTFLAILVRDAGVAPRVAPALVDGLGAADARRRAFACEALGYLAWDDARPHLKVLLADATVVPGYAGEPTVAEFAERALRLLAAGGGS